MNGEELLYFIVCAAGVVVVILITSVFPGSEVMRQSQPQRILVDDRITANRRATIIVLVLFAIASLPAVYVTEYVFFWCALFLVAVLPDLLAVVVVGTVVSLSLVAVAVIIQYVKSASLLLRLAHAVPVKAEDGSELKRAVDNVSIGVGLPLSDDGFGYIARTTTMTGAEMPRGLA